jgi:hypothetical protein
MKDKYLVVIFSVLLTAVAIAVLQGCKISSADSRSRAGQQSHPEGGSTGCLPAEFTCGPGDVDLCTGTVQTGSTTPALALLGGLKKVEKEETPDLLHGVTAIVNEKIYVIVSEGSRTVLLYDRAGTVTNGVQLAPVGNGLQDVAIESVHVAQNDLTDVAIDVVFSGKGIKTNVRLELGVGKPILRTKGGGARALRIVAPARFGIQPDFIGDDALVDATAIQAEKYKPPKGLFFMLMLAKGDALLLGVWDKEPDGAQMTLCGTGASRMISEMELPYGDNGQVCVTLLHGKGIWNSFEMPHELTGKVVEAGWKPPFSAEWRCDFVKKDHTADSWIFKYDLHDRTQVGSTVGKYMYPCWFDGNGSNLEACVQTLSYEVREYTPEYMGTVLIYPLNRMKKRERAGETPLTAFTVMDVVRESLGIGPCPGAIMQAFHAMKESN